jgi:hypothetical protein
MDTLEKLPTVKDFRIYGRFYNLSDLDPYQELPVTILCYVFPSYFFNTNICNAEIKDAIKHYCLYLKQQAIYEDSIEDLKNKKELQIRRLEERIHKYYLNKYSSCKCFQRK